MLHAGTAIDAAGDLVSAGGRVLNVVGSGPDIAAARDAAYRLAATISLRGGWYRHDIAAPRCDREPAPGGISRGVWRDGSLPGGPGAWVPPGKRAGGVRGGSFPPRQ